MQKITSPPHFNWPRKTTDEGNAKYLALTVEGRKHYETTMAESLKHMPKKAALFEPVLAEFAKAFAACGPGIAYAATTSTPEENIKAAHRLKAECVTSHGGCPARPKPNWLMCFIADAGKESDE